MSYDFDFRYGSGSPVSQGVLKRQPEEFVVDETLGVELSGDGEHVYLRIEKRDANTGWVAAQIAGYAGIPVKHVGYAGRKDRFAVTRQSFSCYLPGEDRVDWAAYLTYGAPMQAALPAQRLRA